MDKSRLVIEIAQDKETLTVEIWSTTKYHKDGGLTRELLLKEKLKPPPGK